MMNPTSPIEDMATVEGVVAASLAVLARHGRFVRALGAEGRVLQADVSGYRLRFTTPFARMRRAPARYGIEVYLARRGKVFAAWWKPFRVTVFVRGPWMNAFVPGSFQPEPDARTAR